MKSFDVVAYTFQANVYCPDCLANLLELPEGLSTEMGLDELARRRGIDRYSESTFDSGDFPKVVFADSITEDDQCADCLTVDL